MNAARIKQLLRSVLGDRNAAWIHAMRFASMNRRYWELEMDLLPLFLKEGDVAVDVGANSADWTSVLSRRVGASGRVLAFEADPYYADVTAKTIRLLGLRNVGFFPFGLSDQKSTGWLQIFDESNTRVSGTGRILDPLESREMEEQSVQVRLETLDDLVPSHPELKRTRVIKVDVEGSQLMVFQGGRRLIEEVRPVVIVELEWAHLRGYAEEDVIEFFRRLDYHCFVAITGTHLRHSSEAGPIPEGQRSNRVLVPAEYPIPPTIRIEGER